MLPGTPSGISLSQPIPVHGTTNESDALAMVENGSAASQNIWSTKRDHSSSIVLASGMTPRLKKSSLKTPMQKSWPWTLV